MLLVAVSRLLCPSPLFSYFSSRSFAACERLLVSHAHEKQEASTT
jgi:hypothetical protein